MTAIALISLSILIPVLLLKILTIIHKKLQLRLYWIIVPISAVTGIVGPFLYHYLRSPTILVSFEQMISYSLKTGFMFFLVIPLILVGVVCTLYGYFQSQ